MPTAWTGTSNWRASDPGLERICADSTTVRRMGASPEARSRTHIDTLLVAAGWVLQDAADFNRHAAEGVAVREFQLPTGPCDYLLDAAAREGHARTEAGADRQWCAGARA
jgi:hypothetical protein